MELRATMSSSRGYAGIYLRNYRINSNNFNLALLDSTVWLLRVTVSLLGTSLGSSSKTIDSEIHGTLCMSLGPGDSSNVTGVQDIWSMLRRFPNQEKQNPTA